MCQNEALSAAHKLSKLSHELRTRVLGTALAEVGSQLGWSELLVEVIGLGLRSQYSIDVVVLAMQVSLSI